MAVCELTAIDRPAGFTDDGWEEFEETRCERRAGHRRRPSGRSREQGGGPIDRDDDATRRLLFGGYGFHGAGALLLIIGLLILGAAYFGRPGGGLAVYADHPAVVIDRDRLSDYGAYEPYPNGYYAARYGDFVAGSDARGLPSDRRRERGFWTTTTVSWSAGGLLLLFGILVLIVAISRSAFSGDADD